VFFNGLSTSGNSGGWVSERLDLANVPTLGNLLGRHQVWIAFIFESNDIATYPEGVYVDNMVLRKCLAARCVDAAGMAPESDWQVSPLPLGTATLHLEK
jgi:hypothetical protein